MHEVLRLGNALKLSLKGFSYGSVTILSSIIFSLICSTFSFHATFFLMKRSLSISL